MSSLRPVALVAALLVAACASGPGTLTFFLTDRDNGSPMAVTITDRVGILQDAGQEIRPMGVLENPPITNPPGRTDQLRVAWVGGSCDRTATVEFRADGPGYVLLLITEVAPRGCDAIPIDREMTLTFSRPVNAGSVRLEQP